MLKSDHFVYRGKEKEGSFTGQIVKNGFFCVLSVDGVSKEEGTVLLEKIASQIALSEISHLSDFDTYVAVQLKEANLPTHFSLACGFLSSDKFFLKTVGRGEIYVRREEKFAKLISQTESASGYVKDSDFFVFTTSDFTDRVGGEENLRSIISQKEPKIELREDDWGLLSLFVSFARQETEEPFFEEPVFAPKIKLKDNIQKKLSDFLPYLQEIKYKYKVDRKFILIAGVAILVLFLIFSGFRSKIFTPKGEKIEKTKQLIEAKLAQAEEVAFLNLPTATALINEAKTDLSTLKKEVGDEKNKEIAALEKTILQTEAKVLKKEEKKPQEFFDLSLEDKKAQGKKMYLEASRLAVLSQDGKVFVLDLAKKSIDKRAENLKSASLISLSDTDVFVFARSGVYRISSEGKTEKVINRDKDWGEISDFTIYNKNIYLLDSGKSDIYKYLVAEEGYSDKTSYFNKQEKPDFADAVSMAIDASIYVSLKSRILKYLGGGQDVFNTTFPKEDIEIAKVYTNKDLEKVFAWDKEKAAIYVIGKTGNYEREINSQILKVISDFVVFQDGIFVLSGSKIYRIEL